MSARDSLVSQDWVEPDRITQSRSTFSMTCRVEVSIQATAHTVWALLTDAKGFPRWNSTVAEIEGQIREGERLRLQRKDWVWSDGVAPAFKGVRTFVLKPRNDGAADFTMEERFSGVMFALVKGMLPDFRPIFEAYANDLKREAERVARENRGRS